MYFRLPIALHQQTISTSCVARLLSHSASLLSSWHQNPCWDIQKPDPVLTWWLKIQNFWGNYISKGQKESHVSCLCDLVICIARSFRIVFYSIWWFIIVYFMDYFVNSRKSMVNYHIFSISIFYGFVYLIVFASIYCR